MIKEQQTVQLSSKAADLVGGDPKMIRLCQNLGIPLGFGDITVEQLCLRNGLSGALFVSLCNLVRNREYVPDLSGLTSKEIPVVIGYLKTAHEEYRNVLMPQLHANVHRIAEACPEETKAVFNRFFDDFDSEMSKHIEQEEANGFKIEDSSESHDDVEVKLDDFKNILLKYIPESCNIPERYFALIQIMHIADSLSLHMLIEDKILYPLVKRQ